MAGATGKDGRLSAGSSLMSRTGLSGGNTRLGDESGIGGKTSGDLAHHAPEHVLSQALRLRIIAAAVVAIVEREPAGQVVARAVAEAERGRRMSMAINTAS